MCHTSFFTSRALLKKNSYTSKDTYYDVADWDYCFDLRDHVSEISQNRSSKLKPQELH